MPRPLLLVGPLLVGLVGPLVAPLVAPLVGPLVGMAAAQVPDDFRKTPDLDTTPKPTSPGTIRLTPTPTPAGGPAAPRTKHPKSAPSSAAESPSAPASGGSDDGSAANPPAGAESAKPPTRALTYDRREVPLGVGDLVLRVKAPSDWAEIPSDQLPVVEDSKDVAVVARKGFGVHAPDAKPPVLHELIVVCGRARGEYWGDNIRDAAFTQMIAGVEKEAAKYTTLTTIEPEPIRADGARFVQPFAADAELAPGGKASANAAGGKSKATKRVVKLQGVSVLGFYAEGSGSPTVVACSVACGQLVEDGETAACGPTIGSIDFIGAFAPPPKRSWLAELGFSLKKDPTTLWLVVIGAAFGVIVLVGALVMLTRKKRRDLAAHDHDDHADDHPYDHEGAAHDEEGFQAGYEAGLAAARAAAASHPAQVTGARASGGAAPDAASPAPGAAPSAASASSVGGGGEGAHPLAASAPPPEGYVDPRTLAVR